MLHAPEIRDEMENEELALRQSSTAEDTLDTSRNVKGPVAFSLQQVLPSFLLPSTPLIPTHPHLEFTMGDEERIQLALVDIAANMSKQKAARRHNVLQTKLQS